MSSSSYYDNFQEAGELLVDRHVGGVVPEFHRKGTASPTILGMGGGGHSATTATLHSGNWPELARKSCINRLDGNGCWARYCDCDDCRPRRIRRGSNASNCSGGCHDDDCEPLVVCDEQLGLSYEVWGLRPNELPIKGTYIDSRIVPGFKYWVRYLSVDSHQGRPVFPEPVRLLSIGAGYGKRLTFDTKQLMAGGGSGNPTCDHFWSDSCPDGYALALSALEPEQRFLLRTRSDQELGRATVTWVAPEPAQCRFRLGPDCVTARVPVAFKADISLTTCRCLLGCHEYDSLPLVGLARLERPAGSRGVAKATLVEGVRLPDMPDLRLVPAD